MDMQYLEKLVNLYVNEVVGSNVELIETFNDFLMFAQEIDEEELMDNHASYDKSYNSYDDDNSYDDGDNGYDSEEWGLEEDEDF